MRLLLVEDEKRLSEALVYVLKKNNYAVDVAFDGDQGQEMAETDIYDLIILDRMLPRKEGVEILKAIRTNGIKTPVIFLTAKDSITDRVTGLDAGADDYLVKPFSTEELLARVRALSRRQSNLVESNSIRFASTVFEPLKGEVVFGDEIIQLTAKESQLLELLMRNKNQVMTRELILDRVWGMESEVDVNSIELYVYYLRKKLKNSKCNISIKTIRGVGYSAEEVNT
ncbi:response regulator transcription factor [Clostridium sp.]